ncbi:epoxide hydrolase N-terminal domain-containing protein [Fibrella forsythiae]|uniref:Epoxide hydrolase N-terminal domain-containing protein n=1 Tax=Fibrella forsythiae TaxID=2817061 RepID=A0ABS3JTH0_9BACT|nr:epoxide hydrolase N-terminal domain-containing protein [Fibrella forsythiae]MBO0953322.1 epoxide hydrolase N-terminal domain-containing protein [Fibrella forsythiae]
MNHPFNIAVNQATLNDLQARLARTRWSDEIDSTDWKGGTSQTYLQQLCWYWQHESIVQLVRFALVGWLVASCAVGRPPVWPNQSGNYCEPAFQAIYNQKYTPLASLPTDTALTNHFSPHDILLANAAGILPLLQGMRQPKTNDMDARLARLSKLQQVQGRLLLASTEIASLAAELDCEGERADQLATYLDQKDQTRVRNLTLLSVFVGAVTTVASTLIQADRADKVAGISGGLLSAGLGGAAALSSHQAILFSHNRNLLADIWDQSEQSAIYSPFIWYVLNEKSFSNNGQHSIRYNIRQRWQAYTLAGSPLGKKVLYFGAGGLYQADDFHARANMLNQLQASIRSISQDLQGLLTRLTLEVR